MTVNIANISIGSGPDTNTGEPLRTAFTKVNNNFSNLKAAIDGISANTEVTGNLVLSDQTITGTVNNTDITLDPLGIGEVAVAGNLRTSFLTFRGNTIGTQYAGDLVLNASSGNIYLADPIKFPDGSIQNSASAGNGSVIQEMTINSFVSALSNIVTLNGHTANYINYHWANGNPILGNISTVGFSGSYSDLSGTPTTISSFTNDAGFITSTDKLVLGDAELKLVSYNPDYPNVEFPASVDGQLAIQGPEIFGVANSAVGLSSYSTVVINTYNPGPSSWRFENDGNLTFPDSTTQTTAWTGTVDYTNVTNTPVLANVATSGSYDDLSDTPVIPVVPVNVSAFTNDTGYITGACVTWGNVSNKPNFANIATSGAYSDLTGVPTALSQFSNDTNFANVTYVDDRITAIINNAPAALDTLKEIADSLGNSTSLSASLTTLISTKANANAVVSSFTNDAGYITVADVTWANVGGKPTFANVATSGDYNDLSNKPSIPTVPANVSAFTNDAGYITSSTANVISVNGQTGVVTLDLNTYTDSNVADFLSNYTGEINFIASPAIISGVGTITTQTANVTGNVNASGNVSASYFIGNGSQLTGLPASYTNSNVTSLLSSLGSNVISSTANVVTTANVSGNNVVGNYVVSTLGIYRGPAGSPQIEQGVGGVNWAGHLTLNTSGALIKGAGGTTVIQLGAVNSTDARIWGNLWVGSANTGNITGGNISTSGVITTSGNVTASYFIGNGSQLTGLPASYTNSNVTSLLSAFGSNTLSTTGNVTAGYFIGDGSQLTGLLASYTNSNVVSLLSSFGSNTITTTGNITAGNISGNINITGNITGTSTNVTLVAGSYSWTFDNAGNLSLPGNVFAVKYANGTTVSLGGVSSYGDSNVVTLLSSYGSNTLVTTGNVTTGNVITSNGANVVLGGSGSYVKQTGSNSSVNLSGSISLVPDTGANALNGVIIGGNGYLLASSGARVLTLNTNNSLTVAGNLTLGGSTGYSKFITLGETTTGANAILAGPTTTPLANTSAGFYANINSYSQVTFQNKSTGADATADYILTADNGSDTVNYLDVGIINSGYDNSTPSNSLGNIVYAADSYIYAQGNASATSQSGGNLAIGTTVAGKTIKFFAGGANASSIVANISSAGLAVTGNITTTGNITGSAANVTITSNSYVTTFDTTGTASFPGNVVVTGHVTTANRPGFRVYGSGNTTNLGTTVNTTGNLNINNFTVDYNQGNHLNTSTGVFTAPVAGLYAVELVARVSNLNNATSQMAVQKNGTGQVAFWEVSANSTVGHMGTGTITKLAVGDTLNLKVVLGNINFDSNDNWSVAFLG